ncbi:MAG: DUF4230 domain-containing protein [Fretibacterium sp.]|nr:DUF4230 domain-containing protein [Fretibacterium sp.]
MSLTVVLVLILSVAVNVLLVLWLARRRRPEQNRSVRTAILSGIQNVNELATVRERFQSIVSFSEGWKLPLVHMNFPGTTRRFMMRYSGTIVCGCDLSAAEVSERFDVNRIHIAVPHSRILDIYADVHSFEVYDQSAGLFTSIRLEDQNREVTADLEEVRRHALTNGILAQSDENARRILASIAAATGMEAEIVFTGEAETAAPLDATASPAPALDAPPPAASFLSGALRRAAPAEVKG